MNIADRSALYAEIHRVLKLGGRLAVYDVVEGPSGEPLHFPAPWATTAATSALVSPTVMRTMLEAAGFEVSQWDEPTSAALAWFAAAALAGPGKASSLNLASLMGPSFPARPRTCDGILPRGAPGSSSPCSADTDHSGVPRQRADKPIWRRPGFGNGPLAPDWIS